MSHYDSGSTLKRGVQPREQYVNDWERMQGHGRQRHRQAHLHCRHQRQLRRQQRERRQHCWHHKAPLLMLALQKRHCSGLQIMVRNMLSMGTGMGMVTAAWPDMTAGTCMGMVVPRQVRSVDGFGPVPLTVFLPALHSSMHASESMFCASKRSNEVATRLDMQHCFCQALCSRLLPSCASMYITCSTLVN